MSYFPLRPSKINNMFLVRTFQKISEGGPYYVLFSTNLLLISVLYCYIAKCFNSDHKNDVFKKNPKKIWRKYVECVYR